MAVNTHALRTPLNTDRVDLGEITTLDGANLASWSFWFRQPTAWFNADRIFGVGNTSDQFHFIARGGNGPATPFRAITFQLQRNPAGVMNWSSANGVFTLGAWHHVAATFDRLAGGSNPTVIRAYIDGVDVTDAGTFSGVNMSAGVLNNPPGGSDSDWLIGGQGSTGWADLEIDEVAVWLGHRLTAGEVATLATCVGDLTMGSFPTPDHWWKLDNDYSDSGASPVADGTPEGAPVFITVGIVAPCATLPPYLSAQTPASGASNVALASNVLLRINDDDDGVDLTTVVITMDRDDGAGFVTVYTASAFQPGFAGSATPDGDDYDFVINPTIDFGAARTIQVRVQAEDVGGSTLDETYSFMTQLAADVPAVPNDGGYRLTVTSMLSDGTIRVHFGSLITSPLCFSGITGNGSVVAVDGGVFTIVVPPAPVASGPIDLFIERLTGVGPPTEVLSVPLDVVAHSFRSGIMNLRRVLPPTWELGPRRIEQEPYPQEPS
jgi:hypothetical protein